MCENLFYYYCWNIVIPSSFQLSPDFRQRAPSNSSSCGRLSPRQSIGLDSEWTFKPSDYSTSAPTNDSTFPADINELADTLADELLLQNDFMQVSNRAKLKILFSIQRF